MEEGPHCGKAVGVIHERDVALYGGPEKALEWWEANCDKQKMPPSYMGYATTVSTAPYTPSPFYAQTQPVPPLSQQEANRFVKAMQRQQEIYERVQESRKKATEAEMESFASFMLRKANETLFGKSPKRKK